MDLSTVLNLSCKRALLGGSPESSHYSRRHFCPFRALEFKLHNSKAGNHKSEILRSTLCLKRDLTESMLCDANVEVTDGRCSRTRRGARETGIETCPD